MSVVAAILIVLGAAFCLLAAIGVLRFPDVYTRLHAVAKAGPLGAGLILVGGGLESGDLLVITKSFLGLLFLILVGPISAHLLARAALRSGIRLAAVTSINDLDHSR